MTKEWAYIPGDHWLICDVCGEKHRRSEMRQRWDGLWVDSLCYETRQPQDFVKAKTDKIVVDVARPRPADNFTGPSAFGAYADDAAAAAGGVSVGGLYINTTIKDLVRRVS